MTIETTLFLLRVLSGGLLFLLLIVLLVVLWRDYRSAALQVESNRRAYGRLTAMQVLDGTEMLTGETYPLLPLTSIGRATSNTIPIEDAFASQQHALLALRNGSWWLEDRHSRNGTMLNGIAITQPIIVTEGDVIGIGNIRFRVELEK